MKADEFYEKERLNGNTDDITSNPDPDYSQKFYQNIFRFANTFAAHIIEEVRKKAEAKTYNFRLPTDQEIEKEYINTINERNKGYEHSYDAFVAGARYMRMIAILGKNDLNNILDETLNELK